MISIGKTGDRDLSTSNTKDNRDQLPYQVYLTLCKKPVKNEERQDLGKYLLDPHVSVGEYIVIDGSTYRVKRVTYVYEYKNRRHIMTAKKLDVYLSRSFFASAEMNEEILQ